MPYTVKKQNTIMEISIHKDLRSIANRFDAILLDAYGVFWQGNSLGLYPESSSTLEGLVKAKKIVGILSNSTQLGQKEVEKLHRHGLIKGTHFHFLITSGDLAQKIFRTDTLPFATRNKAYHLFGPPHPKFSSHATLFENSLFVESNDPQKSDFIYLTIPHIDGNDKTDLSSFKNRAQELIETRLPMVCANPDRFAHEGNPPKAYIRQGSIAHLYEELGGSVFYIGKPSAYAFQTAYDEFCKYKEFSLEEILMVGDTPETDIRGSNRFKITSCLITNTGIFKDRINTFGLQSAIESLSVEDLPDFYIEALSRNGF